MSTLEALNAISEAIQAHAKLPEVERSLKEAREAHDFTLLELEEARAEINALKMQRTELKAEVDRLANDVLALEGKVDDFTIRNANLDASLHDVTTLYNDSQHTITERNLQIDSLRFTCDSLSERLAESKSVTARLTDTLKSIGASIVSAIAEPEVSTPPTFRNPVAMPDPASTELDGSDNLEPMPAVVEPTGPVVVSETIVTETGTEAIHHKPEPVAAGCNVYRYW